MGFAIGVLQKSWKLTHQRFNLHQIYLIRSAWISASIISVTTMLNERHSGHYLSYVLEQHLVVSQKS